MCTPVIGAVIGAAGQVASFAGQQQQTDAYNAAAMQNAQSASLAAANQYADEGRKMIYNTRQVQQEGFQAVMKGRQAVGTAEASAGASGIDASSLSLGPIINNLKAQTAQSVDNMQTKMDDINSVYTSESTTSQAQAQGRINSMPIKADPNPLSLGINIASDAVGAFKNSNISFPGFGA